MSNERAGRLLKAMVMAGLNQNALARKSGLPVQTVVKAMGGRDNRMSEVIYDGLIKACEEEIAHRPDRPAAPG